MRTFKIRTKEEIQNMTEDEFTSFMEEFDRYTELKRRELYESEMPRFSSVEELMAYYQAIPLEEADKKINMMFDENESR